MSIGTKRYVYNKYYVCTFNYQQVGQVSSDYWGDYGSEGWRMITIGVPSCWYCVYACSFNEAYYPYCKRQYYVGSISTTWIGIQISYTDCSRPTITFGCIDCSGYFYRRDYMNVCDGYVCAKGHYCVRGNTSGPGYFEARADTCRYGRYSLLARSYVYFILRSGKLRAI